MTSEQIKNLFEPVTLNGNYMSKQDESYKLELSIAKNLLELLGSELKIESIEGIGNTFSFTLTFEIADQFIESSNNNSYGKELKRQTFKGDVLVCEDNETNQLVIQEHLKKMGLNVTIASNGKEGVELIQVRILEKNPFDLIFMDINMPIMNGLQAAKNLIEIGNKTPIVALSANTMSDDLKDYDKLGIFHHITKPFKSQTLYECLLKYLEPVEHSNDDLQKDIICPQNKNSEKIVAIDRILGLQPYDGDQKMYDSVLESFANNNNNKLEELKITLKKGDLKHSRLIIHSLKGAASTIGATRLVKASADLEKSLSHIINNRSGFIGKDAFNNQVSALENEFNAVFNELHTFTVEEKKHTHQSDIIDRKKALELISKLIPILKSGDSKSLEYMSEIDEVFQPIIEKYKLFITQMNQLEFELAYESLKSIQQFISS